MEKNKVEVFLEKLLKNNKDLSKNLIKDIPLKKEYLDYYLKNNLHIKSIVQKAIKDFNKIEKSEKNFFTKLIKDNYENLTLLQKRTLLNFPEFSVFKQETQNTYKKSFMYFYEKSKIEKDLCYFFDYASNNKIKHSEYEKTMSLIYTETYAFDVVKYFNFYLKNQNIRCFDHIIKQSNKQQLDKLFDYIEKNENLIIEKICENNKNNCMVNTEGKNLLQVSSSYKSVNMNLYDYLLLLFNPVQLYSLKSNKANNLRVLHSLICLKSENYNGFLRAAVNLETTNTLFNFAHKIIMKSNQKKHLLNEKNEYLFTKKQIQSVLNQEGEHLVSYADKIYTLIEKINLEQEINQNNNTNRNNKKENIFKI